MEIGYLALHIERVSCNEEEESGHFFQGKKREDCHYKLAYEHAGKISPESKYRNETPDGTDPDHAAKETDV